uniref:Uncharacterized protein n=1 Tax=Biomphalaria glabrata TaxID=6526 RepID=A0A2C9L1X7_BIOGL
MTYVEEEEVILGQEDDIDVNIPAPHITFAISLSELGVDLKTPTSTMDMVSQPLHSIRTEHGASTPLTNAVANDHTAQLVTSSAAAPINETMSNSKTRADHDDEKTEADTTNVQQSTTFTSTTSISTTSTRHVQTLSGPSLRTPVVGSPGLNDHELGMQGTRLTHADRRVGTSVQEGATKAKEQKRQSSNKPQKEMRLCKCKRQSAASCFCGCTNLCKFCQEPCPICEFKAPKPLPPHT